MHDLVIRNGTIIDGTGADRFAGDVAVDDGVITAITTPGEAGAATTETDATGPIVTPGWVDVHTHYDGQATWDDELSPSSWHGVTTAVMGNCGVGFAPVAPDKHEWLVQLMEGVEDIPGTALHDGMTWGWESFPEYLDALDATPRSMDIAAQVPHGAVRPYVMGERGARNEPATPDDIEAMAAIVREAIEAGALGFTTSRTIMHRAVDGEPVPGTYAAEDELFGIGAVLGELGTGLFEVAPAGVAGEDVLGAAAEMDWMRKLAEAIGRPVTFGMTQGNDAPDQWRELLAEAQKAAADGAEVVPQVAGRPSGLLFGLETTYHPFDDRPTFAELKDLPLADKLERLCDPAVRSQILSEQNEWGEDYAGFLFARFERMWPLTDPVDYEPAPENSIAGRADAEGRAPQEVLYDLMVDGDGTQLFTLPILNYAGGDCEPLRAMLTHPTAVLGLGDGGAHCAIICDASIPTFMLTHWARDRTRGERLGLEQAVHLQTGRTADLYGLGDRGRLTPGRRADINVIDHDGLRLAVPEVVHDLPGGAKRLVQRASGYDATIVAGEIVRRHDEDTGARPGRLIRGAQPVPT